MLNLNSNFTVISKNLDILRHLLPSLPRFFPSLYYFATLIQSTFMFGLYFRRIWLKKKSPDISYPSPLTFSLQLGIKSSFFNPCLRNNFTKLRVRSTRLTFLILKLIFKLTRRFIFYFFLISSFFFVYELTLRKVDNFLFWYHLKFKKLLPLLSNFRKLGFSPLLNFNLKLI